MNALMSPLTFRVYDLNVLISLFFWKQLFNDFYNILDNMQT